MEETAILQVVFGVWSAIRRSTRIKVLSGYTGGHVANPTYEH